MNMTSLSINIRFSQEAKQSEEKRRVSISIFFQKRASVYPSIHPILSYHHIISSTSE